MVDDRPAERKRRSGSSPTEPDLGVDHILYLHEMFRRRFERELPGLLRGDPELRGSHRRILQMIPADGCRPTELAARAAMTKQSIGELLAHLEAHGYVASTRDPGDRRAVVVQRTAAGERASARTAQAIAAMEERFRADVGAARYDAFRDVLLELVADDAIDFG